MSSSADEGITDDQLPDDLVPSEDNPLAEGLDHDEVSADEDLLAGKGAEESESDDPADASDAADEKAP
jgi:hypothetical protein